MGKIYKSIYPLLFRLKNRSVENQGPNPQLIPQRSIVPTNTIAVKQEDMTSSPLGGSHTVKCEEGINATAPSIFPITKEEKSIEPLLSLSRQQQTSFLSSFTHTLKNAIFQQQQHLPQLPDYRLTLLMAQQLNRNQGLSPYGGLLHQPRLELSSLSQIPTPMTNHLSNQTLLLKLALDLNNMKSSLFPYKHN